MVPERGGVLGVGAGWAGAVGVVCALQVRRLMQKRQDEERRAEEEARQRERAAAEEAERQRRAREEEARRAAAEASAAEERRQEEVAREAAASAEAKAKQVRARAVLQRMSCSGDGGPFSAAMPAPWPAAECSQRFPCEARRMWRPRRRQRLPRPAPAARPGHPLRRCVALARRPSQQAAARTRVPFIAGCILSHSAPLSQLARSPERAGRLCPAQDTCCAPKRPDARWPSLRAVQGHPCLRVSPAAAEAAERVAARLAELEAAVAPLTADEALKKQRRDIEKKLTVHVQQISGTQNQVGRAGRSTLVAGRPRHMPGEQQCVSCSGAPVA